MIDVCERSEKPKPEANDNLARQEGQEKHSQQPTSAITSISKMSAATVGSLIIRADEHEDIREYSNALLLFREALKRIDKTSDIESDLDDHEDILNGLASCSFETGMYSDAISYYARLLKLRQQRSSSDSEVAQTRYDLAQSLVKQHEYGSAIPLYRQYLATQLQNHDNNDNAEVLGRHNLAYALCRRFEFSEAAKLDRENLNILENQGIAGSDNDVYKSRYQLGINLYYLQDFRSALALAKKNISAIELSEDAKLQDLCRMSKQLAVACTQKVLAQWSRTHLKRPRIKSPSDRKADETAITAPPTALVVSPKRVHGRDKANRVLKQISSPNSGIAYSPNTPTPALLKDFDGAIPRTVSRLPLPKNDVLEKRGRSSISLPSASISTRSESRRPRGQEAPTDVQGNSGTRATNRSVSMPPNTNTFGSYYTAPGTESSHPEYANFMSNLLYLQFPLLTKASAILADAWFQNYKTSTLAIFEDVTRNGQDRRYVKPKADKVKIAIIDSGVKMVHPDIKAQSRRLQTKSFVGGQDSRTFPSEDDLDGHGTHSTLLMLAMVPHAEIYVARVGGEKGVAPQPKDVAEAIDWAHKQWHVDVISMAFGYPEIERDMSRFSEMERAIRDAHRDDVILFAAASNHGAQRAAAFPASMNEVICINSANGGGVQSSFNPQTFHADRTFSVLGEQVKPPVLGRQVTPNENQPQNPRMSGTSTAVTIAAGVAGVVLYLVKTSRSSKEGRVEAAKTRAKSMQGMCLILRWLSSKRDERQAGGEWIVPWHRMDCLSSNDYSENMSDREPVRREIFRDLARYLRPLMPGIP